MQPALAARSDPVHKLLSVNNYYYPRGGAEVVFLEHNALFEQAGWQVTPFAMRHEKNLPTAWSEYFIEEIEYGAAYGWWEKVRRIPKTIYSLEAQRKIAAVIARVRPDLCHLHNIYHHISPSVLSVLHGNGIPVVLTLHDLKLACPAYKMLAHDGICERCKGGRLYNAAVHRCVKNSYAVSTLVAFEAAVNTLLGSYRKYVDRFVVPSRFYLEKFVEWGWDRRRFVYVPNFVRTSAFIPGFDAGDTFVYVGRLGHEKGIATLIRAAAKAKVRLRIVGTGPEEQALRSVAENAGGDVEFAGFLSGAALHDAIRSARAVVLPSEWYENAPMSVLEAYALGKPVIGAAIGGIPELVQEGVTGATFTSGSIDDLAGTLTVFAGYDGGRIADMGRAGRLWMEQDFSDRCYLDRMLAVYRELGIDGAVP